MNITSPKKKSKRLQTPTKVFNRLIQYNNCIKITCLLLFDYLHIDDSCRIKKHKNTLMKF